MKKLLTFSLSILLLSSFSGLSLAQNSDIYQIEVIVFKHNRTPLPNVDQVNPSDVSGTSNAIELRKINDLTELDNPSLSPYFRLTSKQLMLQKQARKIQRNPQYQVLLHTAWRQPLASGRKYKPVHIFGGTTYDEYGNPVSAYGGSELPYQPGLQWEIDGTIGLTKGRFIDVATNLTYNLPVTFKDENNRFNRSSSTRLIALPLLQDRRLRVDELNYIDGTHLGMLIKVQLLEQKESSSAPLQG